MSSYVSPYYRAPEGEDIIGKLAYTSKIMGLVGAACGIVDAQLISKPKGYLGVMGRVLYWTLPSLGMSAAFVSTTYIATNLRKKDDSINYALGGIAAGSVYGSWWRSAKVGLAVSAALAIAGVIKKEGVMNNFEFFPTSTPIEHQTLGSPAFNFTMASEIPGNWTKGAKKQEQ